MDEKYGTTWVAWLQIANVILVNSACSMMWMSAASTPLVSSEWLQASLTRTNWLSNVSAICNSVFSVLTAWSYERFGIKANIIFSAVINLIGCWVRYIAVAVSPDKRYFLMMLGQTISSIGGPFVYKGIANTLGSDKIPSMLLSVAIISTVCSIPCFVLPGSPSIPPSISADKQRMGVKEGVKHLFKNKSFWWAAILCTINLGMVFSVSVLIIEAIAPFGYSDQQAGLASAIVVIAGYPGGILTGYWAGKTAQHIMLIKIFTPFMVFMIPNAFGVILITCGICGFFSYALFPLTMELACEVSYPVPEAISSSVIWSLSTAAMLIFSVIIDSLRAGPEADPPNNMKMSMIVVAVIMTIGSLPVFWLKGELKRLAVDNGLNEKKEKQENN
ncbi:MFS general substrate transporter [Backusella circina FSU 941]|nr:MFS general substrate transporter [Backusella circina FSU 941]